MAKPEIPKPIKDKLGELIPIFQNNDFPPKPFFVRLGNLMKVISIESELDIMALKLIERNKKVSYIE